MREKIAGYLAKAGRPLSAEQILRDVLNIRSPNSFAADKVLRGLLKHDNRFHQRRGLWHFKALPAAGPLETAVLFLQWTVTHPRFYRGALHLPGTGTACEFQFQGDAAVSNREALRAARREAQDHLLLVWSVRELQIWNRLLRSAGISEWDGGSLKLNALAARALPRRSRPRRPEDLASTLNLSPPDSEQPSSMARFLASAFEGLVDLVPVNSRHSPEEIERWIEEAAVKVDFSRFAFGRDLLTRVPELPGVYLMRDRAGEVIYVGKAGNLRRRLRSYFAPRSLEDVKVARIHSQLYSLEFQTCATEVEALLLEMRMIRDFHPAINLQTEVHEQPGRYGRGCNLLLLVPAGDAAKIYFLKNGAFVAEQSVPLGGAPSKKLGAKIRSLYFRTRRSEPEGIDERENEIVARWVSRHRKRLNLLDVDEAGTCDSVLRQLGSYFKDPDRLTRKVYYR
jgi:hypothetical protein